MAKGKRTVSSFNTELERRNPSEFSEKSKILATDEFFGLGRFHVEHLVLLKLVTTKDERAGDLLEGSPALEKPPDWSLGYNFLQYM